jgi:ribonuclease R
MKLNEQAVLRFMAGPDYRPLDQSELARALEIHSNDRAALRNILHKLSTAGKILQGSKSRYELVKETTKSRTPKQLVGTIRFAPKGFAWVYADQDAPENKDWDFTQFDRFRAEQRDCGTALDGDRVMVQVLTQPKFHRERGRISESEMEEVAPKVRVEQVISRRSGKVIGIFRRKAKFSWVEVDDVALKGSVDLTVDTTAQPGQMVVLELDRWDNAKQAPKGRVVEVLGWPGDPGVDILSVIHRNGLRTTFSDVVMAEAHATPETIPLEEMKRREDWRDRLVMTIDPADAKDHDDAIWVERLSTGWRLAVHIADVSHYVKPGTAMDVEAQKRGNSTYLVDRVLPMLPPELSNGICSLKPDVDRLTKCALMEIDHSGRIAKAEFFDAVIHSRAKLSYEEAQAMLDGEESGDAEATAMVREAWKMASRMRELRFKMGSLDLEFPEFRVILDEKGQACEVREVIHTISHQLIEECMLAANDAVALALKRRQKPVVHRVHEDPDFEKLNAFAETARGFGYKVGDLSNRVHVQQLLDSAKGNPDEHVIKLGLLKSLKRAQYDVDPLGHYGLAKQDYCHFTSPIRRYADLVVHRALQPLLRNAPKVCDRTPPQRELIEIAQHISTTERTSAGAESETKLLKLMEWLAKAGEMKDAPTFEGMITEVRPMGLFVEAIAIGMKGVVKREDLPAGDWYFDAARLRFTSREGGEFRAGQAVPLRVGKVDFARKFVDFTIAGEPRDPRSKEERSPKQGGRSQGAHGNKTPQDATKRGKESSRPPSKKARQGEAPKTDKPASKRRRR